MKVNKNQQSETKAKNSGLNRGAIFEREVSPGKSIFKSGEFTIEDEKTAKRVGKALDQYVKVATSGATELVYQEILEEDEICQVLSAFKKDPLVASGLSDLLNQFQVIENRAASNEDKLRKLLEIKYQNCGGDEKEKVGLLLGYRNEITNQAETIKARMYLIMFIIAVVFIAIDVKYGLGLMKLFSDMD